MTQPPDRPQPRYDELELVVPAQPVRRSCSYCGDELLGASGSVPTADARTASGGRARSLGWVAIAALIATVALAIAVVGYLTAPRSTPEPTALLDVSQGASVPESTGAPRPAERPAVDGRGDTPPPAGAPQPQPTGEIGTALLSGTATWYCLSGSSACTRGYGQDDLVAAIDTELGFAKGDVVRVTYLGERSVDVRIVDVCACPGDRLIDLTSGAFARLAPLGLGVIPVTVELASPGVTLPPTEAIR